MQFIDIDEDQSYGRYVAQASHSAFDRRSARIDINVGTSDVQLSQSSCRLERRKSGKGAIVFPMNIQISREFLTINRIYKLSSSNFKIMLLN